MNALTFITITTLLLLLPASLARTPHSLPVDEPEPDHRRPMIFQYPDVQVSLAPGVVSEGHEDDLRLWCESWRFAGEANNLAPWKTIPPECAMHVRDYVNGRAYLADLEMVSKEASAYARIVERVGDGKDAWVFDVDETLISNLPYYTEHHYGLEVFDHHEFDKWVAKGRAPPLVSSLKVYENVLSMGIKAILLTGRSETQRGITEDNLARAGFRDWERLILSCNLRVGKSTFHIEGQRWRRPSVDSFKWRYISGRMLAGIIPILCPGQPMDPFPLLLRTETMQIHFKVFVQGFGLIIYLGMVCRTHLQLCLHGFEQLMPESA